MSALAAKEAEMEKLVEELEAKDVMNLDLQRDKWDKEGELELAGTKRDQCFVLSNFLKRHIMTRKFLHFY